jgi:hypothetical protein
VNTARLRWLLEVAAAFVTPWRAVRKLRDAGTAIRCLGDTVISQGRTIRELEKRLGVPAPPVNRHLHAIR